MELTNEQIERVYRLYCQYLSAKQKNYPNSKTFLLTEITNNVIEGLAEGDTDLYTSLVSVLEAMIYTSSNRMEDMIARAENDYPRRYETMTEKQKAICNQYRMSQTEAKLRFPKFDENFYGEHCL